ncbi:MAG: hypothetical protein LH477_05710 [Nocardioides sp.]|nr:hypothetical protein [Nocardioides sp.]
MSRVLRGAWSRRGALTTLVLMTLVVVGGAVVVLQFARAAGTSAALAAPLLLLGAVAVPSIGAELAVARREEIGLARLRGIHGLRLWRFLLVEPLLAILLGTVAGLASGAVGTVLATGAWLDDAGAPLGPTALLTAATAGAGLVIVALGAAAALREPLAVQVSKRRRPRRATTLTIFLSLLVIVGAGVAAYRSRSTAGEPDLLVLLGPALVGLALGQVAIWLIRIFARGFTPVTEKRGLGPFLATRRLARADDLVTPVRLVVAAAVVGSLALTGAVSVEEWTDAQSRVESGGPRIIDAGDGAFGAQQLTERLDPDGTHLLATALVRNEERLGERRAYVDATRWDAVVGDFYDGTAAQAASNAVLRLVGAAAPPVVSATRFTVTASALEMEPNPVLTAPDGTVLDQPQSGVMDVQVDYVAADNRAGSATVTLDLPRAGARARRSARVPECADGCTVTGIRVGRNTAFFFEVSEFVILVEQADLGGLDLLDSTWVPDPSSLETAANDRFTRFDPSGTFVVNRPDGLEVRLLPSTALALLLDDVRAPVPSLVAGEEEPLALDLSGDDRVVQVVGEATTLPLLGSVGVLSDLRTAALGSGPTVPSTEVRIVAGEGTPQSLLDEVEEATGSTWRPLAAVRTSLDQANGGAQARAYALTALACALVALLALGAGVARHLRDYRRDVASLRVLGIGLGTARQAGRAELLTLTVLVAGAAVAGGWLAVTLLLDGLPLLSLPVASLPLDTSPRAWPLLVPAALAAAAVVVVGGRARAVRARTTRPALLREEEGR